MDKEAETNHQLLRCLKPKLIDILSADPELVLQHAFSLKLVTKNGYEKVRPQQISTEKVTTLLDLIYNGGPEASHGLMKLLKEDTFQETFPRLSILMNPEINHNLSTGTNVYMCCFMYSVIHLHSSLSVIYLCMYLIEASKGTAVDSAEQSRSTNQCTSGG